MNPSKRKNSPRCLFTPVAGSEEICGAEVLARNFCAKHYQQFKKACIANGSWGRDVETDAAPVRPKFEFEGDEEALIAEQGE